MCAHGKRKLSQQLIKFSMKRTQVSYLLKSSTKLATSISHLILGLAGKLAAYWRVRKRPHAESLLPPSPCNAHCLTRYHAGLAAMQGYRGYPTARGAKTGL